jgi:hypothetical protein
MSNRDDDLRVRSGRIRDKSFVGQVTRAAKKAGHNGMRFGGGKRRGGSSTFGRGRRAAAARSLRSNARRVVVKARVVRHHGTRFRSDSLANHISYLRREGVTRDGARAEMLKRPVTSVALNRRALRRLSEPSPRLLPAVLSALLCRFRTFQCAKGNGIIWSPRLRRVASNFLCSDEFELLFQKTLKPSATALIRFTLADSIRLQSITLV